MRLEDLGEPMQITFRRRSAKLTAEAREAIDKVVDLLNRHPKVRVEVRVWTDGKGKLTKHQALSASRAFAIVQALIARGIEAKRVRAAGQGKAKQDGARVILHRLANVQILE